MFKKIKENIVKQIMYKGIVAYSNVLLENLEKDFKNNNIPLTWHNTEAAIRQTREYFMNRE